MISLKRFGAALFALMAVTSAAGAGGFAVESRSLGLAPSDSTPIDIPDRTVSIDIPDEPGITLRYQSDEQPIDISGREDQPSLQTRMFEPAQAVLRCKVDSESAGSLIVANAGSDAVMAGTTIKWQVRGISARGFFSLSKDLYPGQSVRARDVLPNDARGGGKCSARAV